MGCEVMRNGVSSLLEFRVSSGREDNEGVDLDCKLDLTADLEMEDYIFCDARCLLLKE